MFSLAIADMDGFFSDFSRTSKAANACAELFYKCYEWSIAKRPDLIFALKRKKIQFPKKQKNAQDNLRSSFSDKNCPEACRVNRTQLKSLARNQFKFQVVHSFFEITKKNTWEKNNKKLPVVQSWFLFSCRLQTLNFLEVSFRQNALFMTNILLKVVFRLIM